MVVPHKALKPRWKSANVSTGWLAQVAVSARPRRNGVMMRWRRQNFTSVPQALSRGSENTHWNLSATMLSCPWSIWDSFRCLTSNTSKRSFGWIAIKIHNKIKYLKVPTYVAGNEFILKTCPRVIRKLLRWMREKELVAFTNDEMKDMCENQLWEDTVRDLGL